MKFRWILISLASICSGCDSPVDAVNDSMWDGDTRACEVRGFDWALRTTADELEGKWGNDLVRLTEVRMINEPPEMMTGEELIEFFTNDDNFEKTTHEIPYSQIIICRTQEELQEHYLGSGR